MITTWIALVYDFVDKLRELAITGDPAAKKKVAEFEMIQKKRDTVAALAFERDVLGMARNEFELISAQEHADLLRLFDDRNRCGHPNLNGDSEVYSPPHELARLHLRIVVEHVLSKPPVQGKAALAMVFAIVDSEYFPLTTSEAKDILKGSPMGNAKKKLVEDFVSGGVVSLMREQLSRRKWLQRSAAISAVQQLYVETVRGVLSEKLERFVMETKDANLGSIVILLCEHEDFPEFLKSASIAKLRNYVLALPRAELFVLPYALNLECVKEAATKRLTACSEPEFYSMATKLAHHPSDAFILKCISFYAASNNAAHAKILSTSLIMPLLSYFNSNQVKLVLDAGSNGFVASAPQFSSIVSSLLKLNKIAPAALRKVLIANGLNDLADVHVPRGT